MLLLLLFAVCFCFCTLPFEPRAFATLHCTSGLLYIRSIEGVVRQKMRHNDAANPNFFFMNDESTHRFHLEPEISPLDSSSVKSLLDLLPEVPPAAQGGTVESKYKFVLSKAAKVQRAIMSTRFALVKKVGFAYHTLSTGAVNSKKDIGLCLCLWVVFVVVFVCCG